MHLKILLRINTKFLIIFSYKDGVIFFIALAQRQEQRRFRYLFIEKNGCKSRQYVAFELNNFPKNMEEGPYYGLCKQRNNFFLILKIYCRFSNINLKFMQL